MLGTLIIWGTDSNGFWKRRIFCYQADIHTHIDVVGNFDDYDFEF